MGRANFGRPITPPIPHHLHNDGDTIDRDIVEGIQHELPVKPEVQAKQAKCESTDPLGFRWRVPLSWVHNPYGVLALYQDHLDAQTCDKVIIY